MATEFRVYIDESGDEGFVFTQPGRGSSRWFVLSAVVTRVETDLETVKLIDAVRAELGKGHRDSLHFRKLKHEHRLPFVARIAKARVRLVNVLVHKPSLLEPEKFQAEPHLLYRYATRFLLERVSWLCRDSRRSADATAQVIFSNRSCMSYEAIEQYLDTLKARSGDFGVRIDWDVISSKDIEARTHDSLMGLQIADAAASAFYFAAERSPHGFNESRYAELLRPVVYRHSNRWLGYGLKLWPVDPASLTEDHYAWLDQFGRIKKAGPGSQDPTR